MIPADIKFDANATPPQWTDDGEQVIEKGTNIRIKIKGLRSEVDKMFAVGTMKEVRTGRLNVMNRWLIRYSRTTLARCRDSQASQHHRLAYRILQLHPQRRHQQAASDSDRPSTATRGAAP
jgi:hypothetical protein